LPAAPASETPETTKLHNEFWHEWGRAGEITFEQEAKIAHEHVRKAEKLAESLERRLRAAKDACESLHELYLAAEQRAERARQEAFKLLECEAEASGGAITLGLIRALAQKERKP
jgi:uncharacterized protein YukE